MLDLFRSYFRRSPISVAQPKLPKAKQNKTKHWFNLWEILTFLDYFINHTRDWLGFFQDAKSIWKQRSKSDPSSSRSSTTSNATRLGQSGIHWIDWWLHQENCWFSQFIWYVLSFTFVNSKCKINFLGKKSGFSWSQSKSWWRNTYLKNVDFKLICWIIVTTCRCELLPNLFCDVYYGTFDISFSTFIKIHKTQFWRYKRVWTLLYVKTQKT